MARQYSKKIPPYCYVSVPVLVCVCVVEGASAHSNALFLSARLGPPKILRRIVSNMY